MTDKDRELAEDVIRDFIQDEYLPRHRMILDVDEIIELMQAYHSAKMAEVTDEGRKCLGCGTPLGDYCEQCQHLLES